MTRPNYHRENEMRKKAVERENEFLKREVLGKGGDDSSETSAQNMQTNMERALDDMDSQES